MEHRFVRYIQTVETRSVRDKRLRIYTRVAGDSLSFSVLLSFLVTSPTRFVLTPFFLFFARSAACLREKEDCALRLNSSFLEFRRSRSVVASAPRAEDKTGWRVVSVSFDMVEPTRVRSNLSR